MKKKLTAAAVALAAATVARGQVGGSGSGGGYLGPGVLSQGAGTIGQRGGQDVKLRFAGGVNGVYDTGILPLSLDQDGRLTQVGGLFGVEATLQAYGVHRWKRASLGLDYMGNYRHYQDQTFYNGSDQRLVLGYTFQPTRRVVYEFRGTGGTIMRGNNGLGAFAGTLPSDVFDPTISNLFDSRADYIQGGMNVSFLKSARTIFTMGGEGYMVHRRSKALIGINGYTIRGGVQHRLSRATTVGVNYEHLHYDFPRAFGESDIDMFAGMWARSLGRVWTINIQAGAFRAQSQGVQRVTLDPAVAALVGVSTGVQAFFADTIVPTGSIEVNRQFRSSVFNARASRTINPGNGVYLTSRIEEGGAGYSYTGQRKWSFSIGGNIARFHSIGQGLQAYTVLIGNTSITYALTKSLHLTARYDRRRQLINENLNFRRDSGRISLGIMFSPGDLPLSLW